MLEEPPIALPPMTLITTIIPVFNRAHVVGRAVDSVLAQELPPGCSLRIVIVDDGSSDELDAALRRFEGRIERIRHPQNAGASAARNTGIAAAADGFVAFLDSDDVWLPGKLKNQVEMMARHCWSASCTAFYLSPRGRPQVVAPSYRTGTLGLSDLVWGCFVGPGSTLLCVRSVFDEIGPLDTRLRRLEDWDWLLRYGRKCELGFVAQPLARTEPSDRVEAADVVNALEVLRKKHAPALAGEQYRHFLAGIDLELAATRYRAGNRLGMIAPLVRSILRAPVRNDALAAVLHNRSMRR
jgi:glycosyltransferase involved in cell wall biosynthesis